MRLHLAPPLPPRMFHVQSNQPLVRVMINCLCSPSQHTLFLHLLLLLPFFFKIFFFFFFFFFSFSVLGILLMNVAKCCSFCFICISRSHASRLPPSTFCRSLACEQPLHQSIKSVTKIMMHILNDLWRFMV
jgi:hypothetical protein